MIASVVPYASATLAVLLALLHALRHRSRADWALAFGLGILAAESVFLGLSQQADTPQRVGEWSRLRLLTLALIPGVWLLFSAAYARGTMNWWRSDRRKVAILIAAIAAPAALAIALRPALVVALAHTPDGRRVLDLGISGMLLHVWIVGGGILVLMNLERTFRAAVGTMRWQVKFMTLGVALLFVVRLYTSSQSLLVSHVDLALESANSIALALAVPLIAVSYARSRRGDPDVYPSKSILDSSLTLLLAGAYLLIVGVFSKVVSYLGGDASFALKTFVVLVLFVAAGILLQSDHARLQVRRFISRAFQRPMFDFRTVWRQFNECTATQVDPPALCRSLVRLTAETFDALSVSIWLHDPRQDTLQLAASTFLAEARGPELAPSSEEAGLVLTAASASSPLVNIDSTEAGPWAEALRNMHPKQFPHGGDRVVVPLASGREIIGLLLIGDRVGGAPFAVQESDMLKCVADHAAASLRTLQLSQRLLEVRELEAFQTMATFFVHDLKNAASTLNLMLKNLPVHFDDPEFRQDALRGIGKTVDHINRLISRLSSIRHEIKINAATIDLNTLVDGVVGALDATTQQMVRRESGSLPPLAIDAEQMQKVVTNLLLNAREATGSEGEIRVRTRSEGNFAVLTVSDTGCGMSPEFLQRSLFRPFQTTKKTGLGIGMFQTKMIVEAHGGRITATSTRGVGTTFQVHLPTKRVEAGEPAPR